MHASNVMTALQCLCCTEVSNIERGRLVWAQMTTRNVPFLAGTISIWVLLSQFEIVIKDRQEKHLLARQINKLKIELRNTRQSHSTSQ